MCSCVMNGQSRESSVNAVCVKLLRKMVGDDQRLSTKSKVDLLRLLSCHSALKPHIQHVNHRAALYKRAHQAIFEKPKPYDEGRGWTSMDMDGPGSVGIHLVLYNSTANVTRRHPGNC